MSYGFYRKRDKDYRQNVIAIRSINIKQSGLQIKQNTPSHFPLVKRPTKSFPKKQEQGQTHNTANKIKILLHQLYFTLTIRSCPFSSKMQNTSSMHVKTYYYSSAESRICLYKSQSVTATPITILQLLRFFYVMQLSQI